MTRKVKLITTLTLFLVVILMMSFAVYALNSNIKTNVQNNLSFKVEEIQGDFYYSTTTNEPTEMPTLKHVFKSEYQPATTPNPWVITADTTPNNGVSVDVSGNMSLEIGDLTFQRNGSDFYDIVYYFVFVNRGETKVSISTEINDDETNLTEKGVSVEWKYKTYDITKTNFDAGAITYQSIKKTGYPINMNGEKQSCIVDNSDFDNEYKYVVIEMRLVLDKTVHHEENEEAHLVFNMSFNKVTEV